MNPILPPGGIVVGVDGGPHSATTLAWAVDLASEVHRPVTVVHVWSYLMPTAAWGYVAAYTDSDAKAVADAIVRDALTPYIGVPGVDGRAIKGDSWRTLVDVSADSWLLVLGVHRHRLTHGLVGSFARKAVAHARCGTVLIPTGSIEGVRELNYAGAAAAGG